MRGPRSRRGRAATSQARLAQDRASRSATTRSCWASMQERQAAQQAPRCSSPSLALVGIFLLLQTSFGSWRLAVLCFLTLPSALVGGVLAAYARGRRASRSARSSASSPCWDRRAQRHHDDQPLPAPRALRRRAVRPRAGAARRARAAVADPDDDAAPPGWRSCRW